MSISRLVSALALVFALTSCAGHGVLTTSTPPVAHKTSTVKSVSGAIDVDNEALFTYKAIITDVYDGDTVTADVDLGFHTWIHDEKLRLYRIDAPEVRGEERQQGLISRDWLRERISGREVLIRTIKDKKGKYGRYLVEIYLDGSNINDELVTNGFAEYRSY